MKARRGILDKVKLANALSFSNVSLGRRKSDTFIVNFVDRKAYSADFSFKPQDDYHAIEYYDDLVEDMNTVYGTGESTKKYTSPASESDKNQMGDLLTGGAEYTTVWRAANDNLIVATIRKTDDDDLVIDLSYIDYTLAGKADEKQQSKEKGDL